MIWTEKETGKVIESRELRSFGFIVGGIFVLIALYPVLFKSKEPRLWVLIVGGLLIIQAILLPKTLRPIYRVWMYIGHIMGWVNTTIILFIAFYGIFTPMAFAIRLLGKDPLRRKLDKGANTYRVIRTSRPGIHMQRQF